ncbi:AI-2E family transporter [Acetobacter lambici]|uniref:AI-2E family transporter n=1 Tax=Acetobacter lambici TaxID=1332824 RepID=A0ABT1EZX2_9PROT|nr:AI-2E family transporter [Acetobacter lambici]MCP1258271.1 AI-2E family transporter [Acetobacter lambici]
MEQQTFESKDAHRSEPADQSSARAGLAPPQGPDAGITASAEQIAVLAYGVQKLERILRRFYQLAVAVVAALCVGLFIYAGGAVVMVVFAAALVAVVLHGAARLICRVLPVRQWVAVVLFLAALVGGVSVVVHVSGPELVTQLSHLYAALTHERDALHAALDKNPVGHSVLNHMPRFFGGNQTSGPLGSEGAGGSMDFAGSMTNVLTSTFGSAGTLVVIVIAGVYFALSPHLYANGLLRLVPTRYRGTARELIRTTAHVLSAWVAGQLLDMTVVGVLTWVGLSLLGMPLAFPLGLVAGTANFIPYLGTFIGAVPALLIALSISPREALMVAGLYAFIQAFEGYVMSPFIQKRAVSMPPALTILSQTIFGAFLGMWGFAFASPITAVLLAVIDHLTTPLPEDEQV